MNGATQLHSRTAATLVLIATRCCDTSYESEPTTAGRIFKQETCVFGGSSRLVISDFISGDLDYDAGNAHHAISSKKTLDIRPIRVFLAILSIAFAFLSWPNFAYADSTFAPKRLANSFDKQFSSQESVAVATNAPPCGHPHSTNRYRPGKAFPRRCA